MPPHRVGFLCRFGLKTGIDFAHIGLESGAFQFQMSKKERGICRFEWKLRNLFCCCSNLSNDDIIILRCQVLKRVWILQARSESRWEKWYQIIWSEIGSGFGETGSIPPPRILRSTPSPIGYRSGANADSTNFAKLTLKVDLSLI